MLMDRHKKASHLTQDPIRREISATVLMLIVPYSIKGIA